MKQHNCFQHLEVNENSQGSGSNDYLICTKCKQTFSSHAYCCWVRPYPHLSDAMVDKLLTYLGYDFQDDQYAEVQVSDSIRKTYPSVYEDTESWFDAKGSYSFDFSDEKTKLALQKKMDKLDRFCHAFIQDT